MRHRFTNILLLVLFALLLGPHTATFAAKGPVEEGSVDQTFAALEVRVSDGAAPLAHAQVQVQPLGLQGTTDAAGRVRFERIAARQPQTVAVTINASGYRTWIIKQPRLIPQDTLQIDAPLTPLATTKDAGPEIITVPAPRSAAEYPTPNPQPTVVTPDAVAAYAFPATIKVQRVSLGRVDTVDFKFYVKHVLPNEWISAWDSDSLKAGAVAAKQFAWYNTSIRRKYNTTVFDVKDTTADQVYTPNVSYASTDAAVEATWSTIVLKSGAPFQSQFCAGTANASRTAGQCGELYGYNNFPNGYFMSQHGSQYLAKNLGYSWQSILTFYYTNSTLSTVSSAPALPGWPVLRRGDSGTKVQAMQYLLRQRGYSISADGVFGSGTENAVRQFQSAQGLTADGVVGQNTFNKLILTVREGDSGNAVRAIQVLLAIQNTGSFGSTTDQVVRQFQSSQGLTVDGVVGPNTWQAAFGQ